MGIEWAHVGRERIEGTRKERKEGMKEGWVSDGIKFVLYSDGMILMDDPDPPPHHTTPNNL